MEYLSFTDDEKSFFDSKIKELLNIFTEEDLLKKKIPIYLASECSGSCRGCSGTCEGTCSGNCDGMCVIQ